MHCRGASQASKPGRWSHRSRSPPGLSLANHRARAGRRPPACEPLLTVLVVQLFNQTLRSIKGVDGMRIRQAYWARLALAPAAKVVFLDRQAILAISNDRASAHSFNLPPGVEGVFVDILFRRNSTDNIVSYMEALWCSNRLTDDNLILVTAVGCPRSGNRTNLLQTHEVADLVETLGWVR